MVGRDRYMMGRDALRDLDAAIAKLRTDLRQSIEAADAAKGEEAEIREAQLTQYKALADIRLDVLEGAEGPEGLDRVHSQALALLDEHDAYIAREAEALEAASQAVHTLEERRVGLAAAHADAVDAYDARVAEVEAQLLTDAGYTALMEANDAATAVAERAQQKWALAKETEAKKGQPYKDDPLFSYLWKRKYKTPSYKALPFFRTLDHWVAGLCDYEKHYLNYDRLQELPLRLGEHVEQVETLAEEALLALEDAEEDALVAAGADALEAAVQQALAQVSQVDAEIAQAEGRHRELAERHEKTLRAEDGPAVRARTILEEGLRRASFPDLRVLASETLNIEDDKIVDALVQLRAEQTVVTRTAERSLALPRRLREDLAHLEAFRRQFKSTRLDSAYAQFSAAAFDEVLGDVRAGGITPENGVQRLRRQMRRVDTRSSRGFGGRRRRRSMGLPEILGEVAWEVARQSMRHGSWGGMGDMGRWGGHGTRRRSGPSIRVPRSRGGGGFRTGGGF